MNHSRVCRIRQRDPARAQGRMERWSVVRTLGVVDGCQPPTSTLSNRLVQGDPEPNSPGPGGDAGRGERIGTEREDVVMQTMPDIEEFDNK